MRGARGFGRTLAFAAGAGVAWLLADALLAPVLGLRATLRLVVVASAVAYAAGLGPTPRRRAAAGLASAALGAVLLALPLGIAPTAVGAAGLVAFARSGLLHRARPLRAVVLEAGLAAGGLALAAFLARGGAVGVALALWGYYLVQSLFFVVGGVRPRAEPGPRDPFERARAELLALLGG